MNVIDSSQPGGSDSRRVAEARAGAARRLRRQRRTLRPLGLAALAVAVVGALSTHPAPGLHGGESVGMMVALCAFAAALVVAIADRFADFRAGFQAAVIAAMGGAGVALVALQPRGATGLAGGAAVWMALARLPLALGLAMGVGTTAASLAGTSAAAVLALMLLCALLALTAYFMRRAREDQERTEVLLAQLEDARDEQARAAAIEERGRIASELHDVLAHSLSGAAIQLQGARMLAERERAGSQTQAAIDRASALVKDGLASARQAVAALRGDDLPSVAQLPSLIDSFREDMMLDVSLAVDGDARVLPADAGVALYRGVQEALTNVARYAPGASTSVVLRYQRDRTTVTVEDLLPATSGIGAVAHGLSDVGGGRGLAGMRERIERSGGSMHAGPTEHGWRVELEVPA